jgi:tRNA A-37 threonylcarbamoyl transferase component Bud32
MYPFAASFLAFFSVTVYNDFWGPEPPGIHASYRAAMVLAEVEPASAAEQAGLKAGDRIISIDAQPIRNGIDWLAILANLEVDVPHRLEIERDHDRLHLTLSLWQQKPFRRWETTDQMSFVSQRGAQFLMLVLSLVIAFTRPRDIAARIGALLLANFSIVSGFTGVAALWRHLPALLGALLWIADFSVLLASALFFTFVALFPERLFQRYWIWIVAWIPIVLCMPGLLALSYHMVYRPEHLTGILPPWLLTVMILIRLAYYVAGFVALIVNYRRLEQLNQKRRVRVLVAGLIVGLFPFFLSAVISTYFPILQQRPVGRSLSNFVGTLAVVTFPLFPLSFAYSILRHQLFDIRLIIRQGLRYAAARGVLLYAVPVAAGVLVFDFYLHRDQTVAALLAQHGWPYALAGAAAALAHWRRQEWMQALDRRFFRERYDAQRLLREVVEEVRQAGSFQRVAPLLVARIELALHPDFVALLVREPRAASFRSLAAAPSGQAPPPFAAESKWMALVRLLGKPVEVSLTESGWLMQQLHHEETDFLRQARINLLVPIATSPEHAEALLVLGTKRSEEPYTREDQDLLGAIAASLALLMTRAPETPARVSEAFEECPKCGACYDTGAGHCSQEGATLLPIHLPRLLAGRYHLERRRGRGGMGAVYEATDTALDRRVAVKVIRDELVGSPEAAERFRREARAAASFAHPNVVTIYDFGVAGDTRAFLVMELLKGLTLREHLEREKRLEPARAAAILRGVSDAVEAAHRRQLVHRDLKPENIFLAQGETGEIPKVLDFGIAKFLPADTQATRDTGGGALFGTVAYLPPEQWLGQPVDASWDLWALSVVAYEMLTGSQHFAATTAAEWQVALLAGNFIALTRHLPEAPARWQDFFARSFAVDRAHRPKSASVFFTELERALS